MADKKEFVKLWLSYESYFASYSDAEVGRLVRGMISYRATREQPVFGGNERFVWPAIQREIDEQIAALEAISTARSQAGKSGGRPKKDDSDDKPELDLVSNKKQKKQMLFDESKKSEGQGQGQGQGQCQGQGNSASQADLAALPPELREIASRWLDYKRERREGYKPTGLKSLLSQMTNKAARYGADAVRDVIDRSMSANYTGIVWDWLTEGRAAPQRGEKKPGYNVQRHGDKLTDLERQAIARMMEDDP